MLTATKALVFTSVKRIMFVALGESSGMVVTSVISVGSVNVGAVSLETMFT